MKKGLLLITFLLFTTTLFAQIPWGTEFWKPISVEKLSVTESNMWFKPGKILDGGKVVWLIGHPAASPYASYSFRTTDGGETWERSAAINATRAANIDAIDANIAVASFVDGSLYKTVDGGKSWVKVHSYAGGWFSAVKFFNDKVGVAFGDGPSGGNYYICRTTDGGDTWYQIPYNELPPANIFELIFTFGTPVDMVNNTVWAAFYGPTGGERKIVKSTDTGLTWTLCPHPFGETSTNNVAGISFASEKVGMAVGESTPYPISVTIDGGATWTPVTAPAGVSRVYNVMAVKARPVPGNDRFVLFGLADNNSTQVVYVTYDNGQTWDKGYIPVGSDKPASTTQYFSSGIILNDEVGYLLGRGNSFIYKMGTKEVTKKLYAAPETGTYGLVYKPGAILDNGNTIWFCGHEVGGSRNSWAFVSTDGGKNFKQSARVSGRVANLVAYNGTTAMMATADGWIIRTTDGGTSWNQIHRGSGGSGDPFFNGIQTIGPDVVVAYGDANAGSPYFCKSTDKGLTWAEIPRTELPEDLGTTAYGFQGHGVCTESYGSYAWFTLYNGPFSYVVRTSDYGTSWESQRVSILGTSPNQTAAQIRSISFPTLRYGMAVTRGSAALNPNGGIFLIENTGNLWVQTNHPAKFYPEDSIYIYNVTGIPETKTFIAGGIVADKATMANKYYGAFITYDLGQTWTKILAPETKFEGTFVVGGPVSGNAEQMYLHGGMYLNENFGYAFTNGGWVLKLDELPWPPTSVPEHMADIVTTPKDYSLDQNYPNPFNPSTTIKFKLNKTEHVKLVVYDALGREVRTLLDNSILSGDYSVVFDAVGLSSGVYFYTLQVGHAFETKKMVLMK